MKYLIIFIISTKIFATNELIEEAYIIDEININELPECPKTKTIMNKLSINVINKTYTKKRTSLIVCKTKRKKIKLKIKKTIY